MGSGEGEGEFQEARRVLRGSHASVSRSLALTIPDQDHSETEVRWITMGKDAGGRHVLVVHTFEESNATLGRVRLISARPPTRAELQAYEEE